MNSTSFKFMGAILLLSVALVFSCKATGVDTAADDTTDTGTTIHTVTIVLNGGMGVSDQPQKVEDGKTFTIGNPSKAGFVFKGWSTNNTLSNLDFSSGNNAIKQDITIYAMFNKLYTVTIDPSGGTVKTPSYPVEAGSSLTLTDLPIKTLYTFGGYKSGTQNYTLNTPFVVNGDMTLTAQWAVDLVAVRDMLTGSTTNGRNWYDPLAQSPDPDHLFFKLGSTDPTSLTIGVNWHLLSLDSTANLTTTITASDNPSYLVKFSPSISNSGSNASIDYIISLTSTRMDFHTTDGGKPFYTFTP